MPYIEEWNREDLRRQNSVPQTAGELNYMITSAIDKYILGDRMSYSLINEAIGVLECAKLELYRRVAVPYEDKKLDDNGDVYTCLTGGDHGTS